MRVVTRAATVPILVYRYLISPLLPATCRFQPTCSQYAVDAIRRHGAWKGWVLAAARIVRCHPWGGSGYDPVPAPADEPQSAAAALRGHGPAAPHS